MAAASRNIVTFEYINDNYLRVYLNGSLLCEGERDDGLRVFRRLFDRLGVEFEVVYPEKLEDEP